MPRFYSLRASVRRALAGLVLLGVGALGAQAQTVPPGEGLVADATEMETLRQFYAAYGGTAWTTRTNWTQGTTLADAATWYGVTVAGGDVTGLALPTNNLRPVPYPPYLLYQLLGLQQLDLSGNLVDVQMLPSLRNLPNLQELNLSGCLGLSLDFAALATCPNLRVVRLHNTRLRSQRIGAAVGRMARLEVLDLGNDDTFPNIEPVAGAIPAALGNCRALRELNLAFTNVEGALPASLGRLMQLEVLDVSYAALDAPLPDSLGYCRALRVLALPGQNYGSGMGGDLRSLRRLTNLERVDLSRDGLGGALPAELANNAALSELRLGQNRLTGAVPAALGDLPQLAVVDLSYNQLTQVPGFLTGPNRAALRLAVPGNALDFGSLEPNFTGVGTHPFAALTYSPQTAPDGNDIVPYATGSTLTLTRTAGGTRNRYQWERQLANRQWVEVVGATGPGYAVFPATLADQGYYRLRVTNDWVTGLTLYSKLVYAQWQCGPPVLTISPQVSVEAGNSAVLNVSAAAPAAGVRFTWAPATGLNTTTGSRVTATPAATTVYTVTATTPCGTAVGTASVTVTVIPPPPLLNPPVDGCTTPLANAAPAPHVPTPDDQAINFVRTYTPRVALTDTADVRRGDKKQVQVKTEYLDGLGRPVQTVLRQESPGGHDVVQPVAYDALGRQPRQYQPYAASDTTGAYRPNAGREQYDFFRQDPATTPAGPGNLFTNVVPTGVAYAETAFEPSPLNRVLAQASPGETWALTPTGGHAVRRLERPSTDADAVPRFIPGYDPSPAALAYAGYYPAGELWLTETADEHGRRTQEYKDKQGLVVAKRVELPAGGVIDAANWLHTYYAYDDFPRLRVVVPPKAAVLMAVFGAWTVTPAVEPLLFRYRYDGRGRVVAKQVPGQDGETATVYDQLDRPVLTQDPAQRARAEWGWTKYDALGRAVLTGLAPRAADREALQAEADAWAQQYEARQAGAPAGYTTAGAYPPLGAGTAFGPGQVLTGAHYDDYDFDNDGAPDAAYDPQSDGQFAPAPVADARTTGLPTRTRTRVLGVPEGQPGAWLAATTFYDERARPVQVQAINARAGLDLVTTWLDFAGQPLQSVAVHHGPNLPATGLQVVETMGYDHAGRLLGTRQQVLGADPRPVRLDTLAYNEIGQVTRKTLASGALLQPVDYRYNARGWLTNLNDADNPLPGTLFSLALSYECGFQVPQFNGNVAGQKWRGRDGVERAYGYLYDAANRLRQGDYAARAGGAGATAGPWSAETQRYALRGVSYDENGNLLALQRRGLWANATRAAPAQFGAVDDLAYAYAGNRLQAVDDAVTANQLPRPAGYNGAPTSLAGDFQEAGVRQGTEYDYDANGSLTADRNKGITSIAYNFLNLPEKVSFSPTDYLEFRYAANGQKVAKLVYQTGKPTLRTDYLGPYQYEGDSLRFFPHAEGRVLRAVSPVSGAVTYAREFTLKDHLGNLRLAYRAGRRLVSVAGLEPSDAARETQQFDSASVSPPVAQNVAGLARTGTYVARLNAGGGAPQPLGPLKQVGVQRGDTVLVTAHGLYPQAVSNNSFLFSFAAFMAGLVQPPAPGGPRPDGRRGGLPLLSIGVSAALPALLPPAGGVPLAYVRLLVFNADSTLVSSQTRQLSQAARNNYEDLQVQVIAPQDGYVTAYVANESDADVFFDDTRVEHRQGLQVQETQYDPVGLELAGLGASTPGLRPLNQYKFNGKEFQADLGLNWNHQDWRFFDPQLGRWHVTDPELENGQESWTPYSFGFDNALRYADANGRNPGDGGGGLPNDFVSRAFFGVGMSVVNLVALSWAVTLNTPYKYQQNFVENGAGEATDVETRKVPREGAVQDLKSAAWDVFNVTLAAAGGGGEGKLFEQVAGRAGVEAAAQEMKGMTRQTKGAFTEPNLPGKTVAKGDGVEVVHYTKSGDHGPPHLHVQGGGPETRIGQAGKPLPNNPALTAKQQAVVKENKAAIRKAADQIGRYVKFQNR